MVGAAGGLAVQGLAAFVGLAGIITALLLVAVSPPVISGSAFGVGLIVEVLTTRRQLPASDSGDGSVKPYPFDSALGLRAVPRSMTNAQLCLAWRISFTALQRTTSLAHRGRLVAARQGYLDELERRDPDGFRRWLTAGARPASDPSKYLQTMPDPLET